MNQMERQQLSKIIDDLKAGRLQAPATATYKAGKANKQLVAILNDTIETLEGMIHDGQPTTNDTKR